MAAKNVDKEGTARATNTHKIQVCLYKSTFYLDLRDIRKFIHRTSLGRTFNMGVDSTDLF